MALREVGRVGVRVMPDTKGFRRDLQAFLKSVETDLHIDIPVSLDMQHVREDLARLRAQVNSTDLQAAVELDPQHVTAESEKIRAEVGRKIEIPVELDRSSMDRLQNSFASIGRTLARMPKVGGIAALGITAGGALPQVLALAGSLMQLAGVAALLPAAGAAGAAAIGALALGLHGFGQALKDAGDPTKFAADLKKLAPPARDAAKAIQQMRPQLHALQQSVQGELFHGMAGQLTALSRTVLPVLQQRLGGVARALNTLGTQALQAVRSSAALDGLHDILKNTQGAIAALAPAVKPVITALGQMAQVGSGFLPQFAASLAGAAQNFGRFIDYAARTGQISKWISAGTAALHDLFDVALGAGQAIGGIVSAAQKAGGGTLHAFAGVLNQVANVINGPAFQKGLTSFFAGFQTGAKGVLEGLKPLGSLIASLAPIAGKLAAALGPILGQALSAVASAAQSLLPALKPLLNLLMTLAGGMVKALGPVLGALAKVVGGTLAAAFHALTPGIDAVVKAWGQLGKLFSGAIKSAAPMLAQMGSVIGGVLATAMESLAQVMPSVVEAALALMPAFEQLMPVVMGLVVSLTPLIPAAAQLAAKIALLMAAVLPYVIDALAIALQAVAEVIPPLVSLVVDLAKWIGDLIGWVAKLTAEGQASFTRFTAAAIAALDSAYQAVVTWGANTYNAVSTWMASTTAAVANQVTAIYRSIRNGFDLAAQLVAVTMSTIQRTVSNWMQLAQSAVSIAVSQIKGAFGRLASIPGQVSGYFSRMVSAASSEIGRLLGVVGSIPGRVRGALGNLGGILFGAGQSIIRGLIDGIESMIGSIRSALGSITSLIPDWKGPPSKDAKLLGPAGKSIMQGLIDGIESQLPALRSTLGGVSSVITDGVSATDLGLAPSMRRQSVPYGAAALSHASNAAGGANIYVQNPFTGEYLLARTVGAVGEKLAGSRRAARAVA